MEKNFAYRSKVKGYKIITHKSKYIDQKTYIPIYKHKFEDFLNIKYVGFNIFYVDCDSGKIYYQIDNQTIRKLKIKQVKDNLDDTDKLLLKLLKNSDVLDYYDYPWLFCKPSVNSFYSSYLIISGSNGIIGCNGPTTTTTASIVKNTKNPSTFLKNNDIIERKKYLKYQTKQFNSHFKLHENKKWFCK